VGRAALLGAAAALLAAAVVIPSSAGADPAGRTDDWRDLLGRAVEAGREHVYEGRLMVVSFEGDGPVIGEVAVAQDGDGSLLTGPSESWMLGHRDGETFLGDHQSSTLLRVGGVERAELSLDRLARKYAVSVEGETVSLSRPAAVVAVRERDGGALRERLHVDVGSGLILRRETYDRRGTPVRLAAFTSLDLAPVRLPPLAGDWERTVEPTRAPMPDRGRQILRDAGWVVPEGLPGGFGLVDASAVGEGGGSSLHLLFTDGLYTLSVYQQHGRPDGEALRASGARPARVGPVPTYRWPGAEPAVHTWSGGSITFTAVTDAPADALAEALAALPYDQPPSLLDRLERGMLRVAGWVWPF
jgi:hypothetical protein